MSIEGNVGAAEVLRGRINLCDLLVISAYAIAVKHGFVGTEEEWLESLRGEDGISSIYILDEGESLENIPDASAIAIDPFGGGEGGDALDIVLDTTLTLAGYAADAKAVGDKFDGIEEVLDAINGTGTIPGIDLSGYARAEDIPTKVSQLENDSGYLTEHQDLSGYATEAGVDSKAAAAKTEAIQDAKSYTDSQRLAYTENGAVIYDGALEPIGDGRTVCEADISAEMIPGKYYTVKMDSGTYTGVCRTNGGACYVGNALLMEESTAGESYCAVTIPTEEPGLFVFCAVDANGGTHCTVTEVNIKAIDPMYMPGLYIPVVDIADPMYFSDEEKAALVAACGGPICLRTKGFAMLMSYASEGSGENTVHMYTVSIGTNDYTIIGFDATSWTFVGTPFEPADEPTE